MVKSGKKCRERIGCARQRHDGWFCGNKSVFLVFFHVCKDHWALIRRNISKGGRAGVHSTEIGGRGGHLLEGSLSLYIYDSVWYASTGSLTLASSLIRLIHGTFVC